MKITYKKSGVDINKANIFKSKIKPIVRRSFTADVLTDIGGFGSFYRLTKEKYKDPILVSSSDGVGTKLKIACLVNKHDTVGIDAVAMNVNDILCTGAKPLFFLDYIAFSKLSEDKLVDVLKGISNGCIQAGCSLIGGETAQMPGMYKQGEYDIAGFCVGVVEKKNIINGSKIKVGDAVIGLESNGLHSNGYSLVRKVFAKNELKRMQEELLKPTRIYVKPILSLLSTINYPRHKTRRVRQDFWRKLSTIHGIAHITGGAFYEKIARILPSNVNVKIHKGSWNIPTIFRQIQNKGNISNREMFHTLNMGIGMVLIVKEYSAQKIISRLRGLKLKSWVIGEVIKGKKEVEII